MAYAQRIKENYKNKGTLSGTISKTEEIVQYSNNIYTTRRDNDKSPRNTRN